ncbi:MAG: hypothetical protein LBH97_02455, partial [Treponema sp.]|nr:hypothetical protein [Treponema sp.]
MKNYIKIFAIGAIVAAVLAFTSCLLDFAPQYEWTFINTTQYTIQVECEDFDPSGFKLEPGKRQNATTSSTGDIPVNWSVPYEPEAKRNIEMIQNDDR